ncbi:MAG: class I SAM-dependent methyltransferase [Candidatus Omnitrophota bacterium]
MMKCPICGTTDLKYLFSGEDNLFDRKGAYDILFCKLCKLGISKIDYHQEYFAAAYPNEYYTEVLRVQRTNDITGQLQMLGTKDSAKDKKILEIGCAAGDVLAALARQGARVTGVEPNPYAAALASEKNVPVYRSIEDVKERDFDVIILFDTLEHMPDPLKTLSWVREHLAAAGTAILSFPNFASLEARMLRQRWFALELPRHLFHFTPNAVKTLALHSKMKLRKIKYIYSSFFLKSFFDERLKKRPKLPILKKRVFAPFEVALYILGNRPYMVAYLGK